MAGSSDGYHDRRRRRSPSDSPGHDGGRRRRDGEGEEYSRSSRRRDEHRSSRRDNPSGRGSHRRDRDHRRRERRDSDDDDDDRRRERRHRHTSPEERSHRRRRDRDAHDDDREHKPSASGRRRRRSPSRSRSPSKRSRSPSSRAVQRSNRPLPSQNDAFTSSAVGESSEPPVEKQKPNFGNTGRLAAESNTVNINGGSVVLKYHEPPEARKPPAKEPWRLYVFKGNDLLEVVELHERSCWLIGKERMVVDFPLDHPSCSKQHATIQFRYVEKRNEFGDRIGRVKPYIIDLESANGSSVNGEAIPRSEEHTSELQSQFKSRMPAYA